MNIDARLVATMNLKTFINAYNMYYLIILNTKYFIKFCIFIFDINIFIT